jgi:hypothetical protein
LYAPVETMEWGKGMKLKLDKWECEKWLAFLR